jgi:crotonobetainyl-CoA:carnitine CoA-transferase CaiB-like acyl-CoA transferase
MNEPALVSPAPLSGIRVLDWTHVLSGPAAAFQLAALGADVIRLERADRDDLVRASGLRPELRERGLGEGYCMLGAGRRCIALDAKRADIQPVIEQLIAQSDVLLENFRPGKLAALGFDPARLVAQYPHLVVCSISGYPQGSSQAQHPAYDHAIQAASGLMMSNADAQGQPQRIGFPIVDHAVGMQAAQAVLAALLRRFRGSAQRELGEWLHVSMLEAAVLMQAPVVAGPVVSQMERPKTSATAYSGSAFSGTFNTRSNAIALVCNTAAQAQALLQALAQLKALPESDVQRLTEAAQASDVATAQSLLAKAFASQEATFWCELLLGRSVPVAQVVSAKQAYAQLPPRLHADVSAGGQTLVQGLPLQGAGFASNQALPQQLLPIVPRGAHTREILLALGIPEPTIAQWLASGAAWQAKH